MNRAIVVAVPLLLAVAAAHAQTASPAQPALISETTATSADSPAVQAAKRAVAARRKSGKAPIAVITQEMVAKSTAVLSTTSGAADVPAFTPGTSAPPSAAPVQRTASTRPRGGAYDLPEFDTSCEPRRVQNTSAPRTAQSPAPPPTSASPAAPAQTAVVSATPPRQATTQANAPQQSQNAGPNRVPWQ